jgi:hypothetical protein
VCEQKRMDNNNSCALPLLPFPFIHSVIMLHKNTTLMDPGSMGIQWDSEWEETYYTLDQVNRDWRAILSNRAKTCFEFPKMILIKHNSQNAVIFFPTFFNLCYLPILINHLCRKWWQDREKDRAIQIPFLLSIPSYLQIER